MKVFKSMFPNWEILLTKKKKKCIFLWFSPDYLLLKHSESIHTNWNNSCPMDKKYFFKNSESLFLVRRDLNWNILFLNYVFNWTFFLSFFLVFFLSIMGFNFFFFYSKMINLFEWYVYFDLNDILSLEKENIFLTTD